MNAIAETSAEHMALLNEYRIALRLWSEVRGLLADTSPEAVAATLHLEEIERDLVSWREPTQSVPEPDAVAQPDQNV